MENTLLPRRLESALTKLMVTLAMLEREVTAPRDPRSPTRLPVLERRRRTSNALARPSRALIA